MYDYQVCCSHVTNKRMTGNDGHRAVQEGLVKVFVLYVPE